MVGPKAASWQARPIQAAALRVFIVLAPVGAALTTAALVAPLLPASRSLGERLAWWLLLCVLSTGPLLLTDRAVRRLLPLSSLLRLSMLFPGTAPSRLGVARQAAGVRNLQRRTEEARRAGVANEPVKAAETVLTLVTALSQHDPRTRGHSERVHLFVEKLAKEMGVPEAERAKLRWAALVHDIGKIEVSTAVLNKPGPPDGAEWEQLLRHPIEGARFCIPLREWLGEWASAIEQHHERWDGTGYPLGLAGKEISRGARIVAVADAYETMTAARAYKKPLSAAAAREELARCAGTQFDPDVVRAFLSIPLGRVRWASGAMSWVAQWPLVGQLPRLGEVVAVSSVTVAGAATLAVGGFVAPGQPSFGLVADAPPPALATAGGEGPPIARDVPQEPRRAVHEPEESTAEPERIQRAVADYDGWDRSSEATTESSAPDASPAAGRQRVPLSEGATPGPDSTRFPAGAPEGSPGSKPEESPGNKPEERPGSKPGESPGSKPEESPGNEPEESPGSKPEESPGSKPEESPGSKPEENPGNKPEENPGNKPEENPGNKPEENPGNKPEENPGNKPEGNPGNGPDAPPGQED